MNFKAIFTSEVIPYLKTVFLTNLYIEFNQPMWAKENINKSNKFYWININSNCFNFIFFLISWYVYVN